MPTNWNRVAGDVSDTITPIINGVADLSGVTAVETHVWTTSIAPVTLATTVASSSARTLTVQLGTWLQNTAVPGTTYKLEYQITFTGGRIETWPERDPDTLYIRAQGA